jgi:hypothetical protein
MSSKITHIVAVVIIAAIAGSATSSAWAQAGAFGEPRGSKTYMPGEGGCKDDSGHGWVTYGCGD